MKTIHRTRALGWLVAGVLLAFPLFASAQPMIVAPADAAKVVPDAVYFAGQSASTQLRNATGLHFADGPYTLAVLVDTSGYSTAVQQKYQGYLLTDVPLMFEGHRLAPGAYGFGFVANGFLVMDIGAHDLFSAPVARDAGMQHPVPLRVYEGASPGIWRLCSGRSCVNFRRTE